MNDDAALRAQADDPSETEPKSPRSRRLNVAEQETEEAKRIREEEEIAASTAVQWFTPSNTGLLKTGSRKKAVARPEDPGGVEDVSYSAILFTVPTELFKLDGLHHVLNPKTCTSLLRPCMDDWMDRFEECLSKGEQDYLLQFLPEVDDPRQLLSELLDGQTNFAFGNPLQQIWELMKQGECHPRVAKYREALRCLQHCQHFLNVRDYHNKMVKKLREMSQLPDQEPLQQRVRKWNAMTRDTVLHTGREIKKPRKRI